MSLYGDPLKIGRVVGSAEFLELLDKLQRETGIAVPANLLPSESQLHSILVQDVLELFRELKALVPAA
jgi:acyl carrier protein